MTYCNCSSSIGNWESKIKRYGFPKYNWLKHWRESVIFFGFYNPIDYLKFFLNRGKKTIVWCGSDILQTGWLFRILQRMSVTHIGENQIEWSILSLMLRKNVIQKPLFFSNPNEFPISYRYKTNPEVFIHINKDAEAESGYFTIERIAPRVPRVRFHIYGKMRARKAASNIIFHGYVPEEQFNREIKNYQGALRLHHFDGFAETLGKSILMGQWPISAIKYPLVQHAPSDTQLINQLDRLSRRKRPNIIARSYYLKLFTNPPWNVSSVKKNPN